MNEGIPTRVGGGNCVALRLHEEREDTAEAPVRVAKCLPVVVIQSVPSNIEHVVDAAAAAHHVSPRKVAPVVSAAEERTD